MDGDLAAVLGAMAVRAGAERAAGAATRVLDADTTRGALVHLQHSALDPTTVDMLKGQKDSPVWGWFTLAWMRRREYV